MSDEDDDDEKVLEKVVVVTMAETEEIEKSFEKIDKVVEDEKQEEILKCVKVSAGCGPSPDREIEEIFANENVHNSAKSFTPLRETPSRSSKVSIGTSPPPQDTSTQVIFSM